MKKIHLFSTVALLFLFIACSGGETDITPQVDSETVQGEFFANLFERCGETFSGVATYPDDPDHELVGANLTATIQTCTEEEIRIALDAGAERARTLIINRTDDGLNLRHIHRNPDETSEDITGYGGPATDEGGATRQYFAADDSTKQMMPEAETNVWVLDLENDMLTYYVERNGETEFRAELTKDS